MKQFITGEEITYNRLLLKYSFVYTLKKRIYNNRGYMRGNPDKGPQKQDYDLGYGNAGKGPKDPYFPSEQRGNDYNSFQSQIVKRDDKRLKSNLRRKY